MNDPAPLFTCAEPEPAQGFLRRLRARQRNQILFIILAVLFAMSFAPARHGHYDVDVAKLFIAPGLIAILVRLLVPGSRRPGIHIFRNDSARIYAGGIWCVFQDVDVKKIQEMLIQPVSFAGAEFYLILLVFRHRSGGRSGGVFPLYFCVQNSDLDHVRKWCQERNIDVRDGSRVTSPNKLPLFLR
jgi:hypothetical protein